MMTDGVADSFLEEQECFEILLWECLKEKLGPQDIADRLLDEAMVRWNMEPEDDLSVMVVKIYDNAKAAWRMKME